MILNKILLAMMAFVLSVNGKSVPSHQSKKYSNDVNAKGDKNNVNAQNYSDAMKFISICRKLRHKLPDNELRIISTIGLVSGALQVEDELRENLYSIADNLFDTFNKATPKENTDRLLAIEETINRDKVSIAVLNGMMKFARNETDLDGFHKEMQRVSKQSEATMKRLHNKKIAVAQEMKESVSNGRISESTGKLMQRSTKTVKHEISKKLYDVKEMIDKHVDDIHFSVNDNAKKTLKFIQSMQRSDSKLMRRQSSKKSQSIKLDPSMLRVNQLWDQVSMQNSDSMELAVALKYHPDRPVKNERSGNKNKKIKTAAKLKSKRDQKVKEERLTLGEMSSEENIKRKDNLIDAKLERFRRHSKTKRKETVASDEIEYDDEKANQEDEENEIDDEKEISQQQSGEEFGDGAEPNSEEAGGLVGLISNLSGGEGGSDIGAVFGALSQVLSNVLGPGGIDVESVIGSGTTLLASLLSGEENFGKILGNYVGTAIDGFSGGGGAANNGQFFGQFVGKFISALSADPDDDDAPLQPGTFLENLLDGLGRQLAKDGGEGEQQPSGGSDSGAFLTHVITTIVAGITKGSAGASLGSSGGSSQGSVDASGGSSQGSSDQSQNKPH